MTKEDVQARIDHISANVSDDEHAHAKEDQLYLDLLTAMAAEGDERAALAITTQALVFSRWCA